MLAQFGVGQVFLSILWFFLFFIWIMLVFQVVVDIFRSHDLGGVAKALWVIFIIVLPYLGVLVYLIARGGKMAERQMKEAQASQAAMDDYIRNAAGTSASPAQELERLAALKDNGVIDEAEFGRLKAKILG